MAENHRGSAFFTPPDSLTMQNQPNDASEEVVADVDEPPDRTPRPGAVLPNFCKNTSLSSPLKLSVLTQMLHSSEEADSDDDDDDDEHFASPLSRGLSTTSTWSNPSLTSDGGLTSPDTRASTPSPPLPAILRAHLPSVLLNPKPLALPSPVLKDANDSVDPLPKGPPKEPNEQTVEAGLGRKRCITFACGKKEDPRKENPLAKSAEQVKVEPAAERKCSLRFVCPTKTPSKAAPGQARRPNLGRPPSPAPSALKSEPKTPPRARRASISSAGSTAMKPVRKSASAGRLRRLSIPEEYDTAPTERLCEYAGMRAEDDDWMKERTCHRSRLTVDDTLKVEMKLRSIVKEAEEEEEDEIEAEEELDREGLDEEADEDEDGDEIVDEDEEDLEVDEAGAGADFTGTGDDISDDGFYSDDEGGMGDSSDESDAESEFNWWTPGRSTAATSYDQLDQLHFTRQRNMSGSSIGSRSSTRAMPGDGPDAETIKKNQRRRAMPIRRREADLPDSTDFVCGTLDEDRPMEEAYIRGIQERRAAKHGARPQDIDPTFPTSDPEMDEEDDDDVFGSGRESGSEREGVFGHFEDDTGTSTYTPRGRQRSKKSPTQSPKRIHSPAPKRLHSPPPKRLHSPPPRRPTLRSPAPRKLFGHSPRRLRSPPPTSRLQSPPPTRRTSYAKSPPKAKSAGFHPTALAERPRGPNTYSSSVPRKPNLLQSHRVPASTVDNNEMDSADERVQIPARGAIDIVKGLEKKKQLRKEKLHQKMCRQRANQPAPRKEERRFQPGKGAERMREMGLELASKWKGEKKHEYGAGMGNNAQHILSL